MSKEDELEKALETTKKAGIMVTEAYAKKSKENRMLKETITKAIELLKVDGCNSKKQVLELLEQVVK